MRLYLLLLGLAAGLWLAGMPDSSAAATPRPTPTIKACHICDEEIIPAATSTPIPWLTRAIRTCAFCEEQLITQSTITPTPAPPQSEATARAVLFWMNGCPHCHDVLDNVLPPLQQKYGRRLEIVLIETSSPEKWQLLLQAAQKFGFPPEQVGVPFMVIGDRPLIGSAQIPAELPGLIEKHLAAGGVDYPAIPGLAPLLPVAAPTAEQAAPQPTAAPTVDSSQTESKEPVQLSPTLTPTIAPPAVHVTPNGFELAIGLMVGMAAALIYAAVAAVRGVKNAPPPTLPAWTHGAIPLLAIIGLGVAGYLAYVETQAVPAVCGPVGDCNAVQSSPYATLFGVLPVGVLGALGYMGILAAWLWQRFGSGLLVGFMPIAIFGMTLFGVLFSLYLTYLEPFVIGAVCMWCLTSAVLITVLMLLSLNPALIAIRAKMK